MIVSLTGGLACGKTTALEYIKSKNYIVYNIDEIAHEVLEYENVKQAIANKICNDIFDFKNNVDRKKLGKIVFKDKQKLEILNSIVQDLILEKMLEKISKCDKNLIYFFEVPILYERNLQKYFDKNIVIYTSRNKQIERAKCRDSLCKENVENILKNQIDIEIKKAKADIVIENNSSLDEFKKNIDKTIEILEKLNRSNNESK